MITNLKYLLLRSVLLVGQSRTPQQQTYIITSTIRQPREAVLKVFMDPSVSRYCILSESFVVVAFTFPVKLRREAFCY